MAAKLNTYRWFIYKSHTLNDFRWEWQFNSGDVPSESMDKYSIEISIFRTAERNEAPRAQFSSSYLERKVNELQPNGGDFKKAANMYLLGESFIVSKTIRKHHNEFKIESQKDSKTKYDVSIVKRTSLARDIMSQYHCKCSCPHYQKAHVTICKHIIYCLLCFYVRE